MRRNEYHKLTQQPAIADMQAEYARRDVAFGPGLDYAINKATAGIRDPLAREVLSTVVRQLWLYLADTLEARLSPPQTVAGRWIRWLVAALSK